MELEKALYVCFVMWLLEKFIKLMAKCLYIRGKSIPAATDAKAKRLA